MADTWISVPIDTDEQALYDDAVATLRALKPGWEPAEGNLDAWILRAAARLASELRDVAADVPAAILRTYGREVFQLPALEPARATVATTWTAADALGHTVPAGAQFTLRDAAGAQQAFRVQSAAVIPAASTSVAGVLAEAVIPGLAADGLSGTPEPVDALAWLAGITLDEPATSGGSDGETDDAYLGRLSALLLIQSDVPILPADFEILALTIPGVARARAADLFDPAALASLAAHTFEAGTTGWSGGASSPFNAAATISQVATAPHGGTSHLRIQTAGSVANEGAAWTPSVAATAGRTVRFGAWLRTATGTAAVKIRIGAAGDYAEASCALTTSYQRFTVDWVPNADQASIKASVSIDGTAAKDLYADDASLDQVGAYGVERAITVFVTDEAGANCSSGVKAQADALLQARREANFLVTVADPGRRTVDVAFTAKALAGYDHATVQAAAESAVAEYLSPAGWGSQVVQGQPPWAEMTHVRWLEIASVINAVEGINYVVTSSLLVNGGTADIALPAPAGLPAAGTIAGTIT